MENLPLVEEEVTILYDILGKSIKTLEPEDLEKLKLKSTKVIEIEGFVDASEVHPTLYDVPYFAGPDGEVAAQAGVCRWQM